jgi:excisionase family DNA binding protein
MDSDTPTLCFHPTARACLIQVTRADRVPLETRRETAARLGVSEDTIDRMIRAERLPAYRVAGSIRIDGRGYAGREPWAT